MCRFRRMAALLSAFILIFACLPALAEGEFTFGSLPQEIRPGKLVMLSFTAATPGDVNISLINETGTATALYEGFPAKAGSNSFAFDGTTEDTDFAPGKYKLQIASSNGSASADVMIGNESPVLAGVIPSEPNLVPGSSWYIRVTASMQGTLTVRLEEQDAVLFEGTVNAGDNDIPWDGTVSGTALPAGEYTLMIQLQDSTGFSSNAEYIPVSVEAAEDTESLPEDSAGQPEATAGALQATAKPEGTAVAPADFSPYPAGNELNYWTLPMDITNEATVWQVLTQPITVLKGDQKKAYALRASPDNSAEAVGEITYDSQGVRVLETLDNGWSLIESYSSSFHGSKIAVWGNMVQGYVKTSLLQTKTPSQKYGLIIDKLTQRMYVFMDGKKFTELAISTGLISDPKKLYTETWAGEYLIVSRVGKFFSDNLQCDMALRFDNGNLIHQVPYTLNADGSKYFDKTEPKLGTKASHGCVRVQRKKNADGVNMSWLWENLDLNTRVLIWEDYKGRQVAIPSPDTKLYYNPEGGTLYHSVENCPDVKEKYLPLTAFTYGQLEEGDFANLQRCPACQPPLRQSELEAVNAAHAK